MPYNFCPMPEYPCHEDMWDKLKNETRPITVYGMGNGADKLFSRFKKYGITPADIFASDGFVRGHSFRGMRVKSFSEIKEAYSDFVVVISFASNRAEVVDMLAALDREYDVYVPDMPVAGESEYFDREFFNNNYDDILKAHDALSDEASKNCFRAMISYKLTGRMSYLLGAYSELEELYSMFDKRSIRTALDIGAYNGDTVREIKEFFPNITRIVAVEPDAKNYKRLCKYAQNTDGVVPVTVNAAAYSHMGEGNFSVSGNRNSSISSTASYEHRGAEVRLITVDSLGEAPDYIKYDVEGAEWEALMGSFETIDKYSPALLISLYHRSRDIFFLINAMRERYPNRRYLLRRLRCLPAWEIDLLVI